MNNDHQRYHGRRASSMRLGLRGLLFTVNPKQEPKAAREISSIVEKLLDELPEELFATSNATAKTATAANTNDDDNNLFDVEDQDDDDENDQQQKTAEKQPAAPAGFSFADELRAELDELKQQPHHQSKAAAQQQQQHQAGRPQQKPRRFRIVDTNCKGYMFVSINFAERLLDEHDEEEPEQQPQQQVEPPQAPEQVQQPAPRLPVVISLLTSPLSQIVLDLAGRLIHRVSTSDVPLLRFTFYLFPILLTTAPTLNSVNSLAEAVKTLVPVPQGKSAARVELNFLVRNNSGVSTIVVDEMRRTLQSRLPMNKFLVMNKSSSSSAARRQRQEENSGATAPTTEAPKRVVNAAISFIVLHSVALLCVQPDYSDREEYALHKMGASFGDL